MELEDVLSLFGGLALFLLGMNSMSTGLEAAAGSKMKGILEKLTANRFVGVLVGALITAVIQSSSATTVMTVGFVNAGMLTLSQAVWVIIGANIGTTITGQIIALNMDWIGPVFAIIGVVLIVFIKKATVREIGKILSGFGILFLGMDMMKVSMASFRESQFFLDAIQSLENPFLGILIGTGFTAIIQSSSASVGILQAMAASGSILFKNGVYILYGMHIGTCITAVLASLGTTRAAKRTTLIHLIFNIFGTILFVMLTILTPIVSWVESWTPNNPSAMVANMHTLFAVVTAIVILPLGTWLVKITEKVLPDKEVKQDSIFMYLNNDMSLNVGGSALHIATIKQEIIRMYDIAKFNVINSFDGLLGLKDFNEKKVIENEDLVDALNEGITRQITKSLASRIDAESSQSYRALLYLSQNIERISDHAMNLCDSARDLKKSGISFNSEVLEEVSNMKNICIDILNKAIVGLDKDVAELEDITDKMAHDYRINMVERLKEQKCHADGAMIYSCVLIDFERIGDHLLNVSQQYQAVLNR